MKMLILGILLAIFVAVPTMIGVLPPVIGAGALLMIIIIKDTIFAFFARGPAMEFIKARISGGVVLGIVERTRNIVFGRFHPTSGMVTTKNHGAFTLMPERIYSADGVMVAIAPEKIGYNVGVDHAQLVEELKKRGINDIRDVCDVDDYGFFMNFKDDSRIKDLKVTVKPWLTTFDDFYKYTTEAANPIHQDANVKIGITQGMLGRETHKAFLFIAAGLAVFFACVGIMVLTQFTGGGSQEPIRIIVDNASHVIPM